MPTYTVTSNEYNSVNYGAKGIEAKLQSAAFLLSLHIGTSPLSREDGWEVPIDEPTPVAEGVSRARITEMLERSIEGLSVNEIIFTHDSEVGQLRAIVKVVIEDE
ncbi:hypothetical protein [Jeotgalibacillus terrae]|uniref:Phage protein n=1 Tax=Jeotgalibacillus terrae TaxID=587735 RepID=A0ABW5ZH73_9BACL|nr:hypothetical protein [Jeotgalibacillus terrae]MBM7580000.1 hypothetical protein [Jeotgalibacillus terrae]